MKLIFIFFCSIAICSCRPDPIKTAPPNQEAASPVVVAREEKTAEPELKESSQTLPYQTQEWSKLTIAAVKLQMPKLELAKDMERFCPNYAKLDANGRLIAWSFLAAGIMRYEAGVDKKGKLNTCTVFNEPTGQDSIGFFQLSYGDAFCPKAKAQGNLCEPAVNLACGTKLMGHFVQKDRVVASGGYVKSGAPEPAGLAKYWSVIRVPDVRPWVNQKKKTVFSTHKLKEIRSIAASAPGCSTL